MTIGSLFSGIGGLELGLERAGLGPVLWQVEIEPFCRDVLARHWPNAVRFEDVRTFARDGQVERPDVICGGFPCQDISPAGKRAGLAGEKSGLWYEFRRVVEALRPDWVIIENNGHRWRSWVPDVRRDLWALGYASVPFRMCACDVGAWHERARIFLVANNNGVLLRKQSGGRIRQNWQGAVESVRARSPWLASDVDSQRQQQPQGGFGEIRGWAGDCVDPWRDFCGTVEPTLARGVHGVPDRMDCEKALGNAVVVQCAETVGTFVRSFL